MKILFLIVLVVAIGCSPKTHEVIVEQPGDYEFISPLPDHAVWVGDDSGVTFWGDQQ